MNSLLKKTSTWWNNKNSNAILSGKKKNWCKKKFCRKRKKSGITKGSSYIFYFSIIVFSRGTFGFFPKKNMFITWKKTTFIEEKYLQVDFLVHLWGKKIFGKRKISPVNISLVKKEKGKTSFVFFSTTWCSFSKLCLSYSKINDEVASTIGSDRIGSDRIGSDQIGSDRIGSD